MRIPPPASRGALRPRLGFFDFVAVVVSPLLALYLSNANALYAPDGFETLVVYCAVWILTSATAFLLFRFQDSVPGHFSAYDAFEIFKAVIAAELVACIFIFTLTRLDGIPRSAPILHASILAIGIITARLVNRIASESRREPLQAGDATEHILVIGSDQCASLYIRLVQVYGKRVVGVLDTRRKMLGRMLEGIRIVGTPADIGALFDEYSVHGVRIDRIVIAGSANLLVAEELSQLRAFCLSRQIKLDSLPALIGVSELLRPDRAQLETDDGYRTGVIVASKSPLKPSRYFHYKPAIDFAIALTLLILLLPTLIVVSIMVLIDVGLPLLFWQRRLGLNGHSFLLYKFRTLRPPFDGAGHETPAEQRLSWIGHTLRDTSLDELPQLINILVGDMSLIGPRPLLPEDQPTDPTGRLLVRPGISGWAQVNGGKFLSADEKVRFDEWYVQNASLWVDLKVAIKTLQTIIHGARRSNEAVAGPDKTAPVEHWRNFRVAEAGSGSMQSQSVMPPNSSAP